MVGGTTDRAAKQMGDALLENLVGGQADRIENALCFKILVDVRRDECGIAAKVEANLPHLVACNNRGQDIPPAVGTVDIAGTQATPFQVTHVVEQEQGVIASTAEVAVVGRTFLVAVGRADAGIHVEDHILRRFTVVNSVDPNPGQVGKDGNVVIGGQELGFDAAHLTCRCCLLGDGPTADDPAHGGILAEAVGIVHVLIASEPSESRLSEKAGHPVLAIFPGSGINQPITGNGCQAEGIVQFSKRKEASIRGDLGAVKFQLQPTVKIEPQNPSFAVTRREGHRSLSISGSTF